MRTPMPLLLAVALLAAGCVSRTVLVDTHNDTEIVAGLDYKDFEAAAAEATQAILSSAKVRALTPPGKVYVVAIGKVSDETALAIDTDLLTARVSEALLADERFTLSAVFADKASNRDETVSDARAVRGNDEFDAATIQRKGQLKAPDLAITGKLTQRNVRRDNGGTRIEYFLTLKATRLADGVALWQDSRQTVKAVAKGMPTW